MQERKTAVFLVRVDLDSVDGRFVSKESALEKLRFILRSYIPHSNPMVAHSPMSEDEKVRVDYRQASDELERKRKEYVDAQTEFFMNWGDRIPTQPV